MSRMAEVAPRLTTLPHDSHQRMPGRTGVDDQRVPAVGKLDDLGHARVALLLLIGSFSYRHGDCVVRSTLDNQQRSAVGVFRVDLGLGPGVEVLGRRLENGLPSPGYREGLVQLLGLVLADDVGEPVAELFECEWYGPIAVGRVAKHGRRRLERPDW